MAPTRTNAVGGPITNLIIIITRSYFHYTELMPLRIGGIRQSNEGSIVGLL